MVLTTHAAAGAAIALAFKGNPGFGLTLVVLSHFVLDAIPHWHYPVKHIKREFSNSTGGLPGLSKGLIKNLAAISADFTLGVGISAWAGLTFEPVYFYLALTGAVLGTIPDFFQLLYFLLPIFPFAQIQRFHIRAHAKTRLDNHPLMGIGLQAAIVIGCLYLIKLLA